jgi:molecular chaperone GrpE
MTDFLHPEETEGAFREKDPLSITDRRHWARRAETGEKEYGKDEVSPSKLPTYLEQLEQRLREKDERLKAFMAEQQAENEAFRERVSRQAERRAVTAKGEVIKPVLSALDDLSRAVESASKENDSAALLEGVKLIQETLFATLRLQGLGPVEAEGAPFDPEVHEAVGVVEVDDLAQENRVLEVVQPGYLLEGDLLRPAKVWVGKHRAPGAAGKERPAL